MGYEGSVQEIARANAQLKVGFLDKIRFWFDLFKNLGEIKNIKCKLVQLLFLSIFNLIRLRLMVKGLLTMLLLFVMTGLNHSAHYLI